MMDFWLDVFWFVKNGNPYRDCQFLAVILSITNSGTDVEEHRNLRQVLLTSSRLHLVRKDKHHSAMLADEHYINVRTKFVCQILQFNVGLLLHPYLSHSGRMNVLVCLPFCAPRLGDPARDCSVTLRRLEGLAMALFLGLRAFSLGRSGTVGGSGILKRGVGSSFITL